MNFEGANGAGRAGLSFQRQDTAVLDLRDAELAELLLLSCG